MTKFNSKFDIDGIEFDDIELGQIYYKKNYEFYIFYKRIKNKLYSIWIVLQPRLHTVQFDKLTRTWWYKRPSHYELIRKSSLNELFNVISRKELFDIIFV